ncbi:MAG: SUMF1/EgtB/PvdO family nonheme iron enzyme, partial [Deltaproteobacteria bacterium]|nr:SUMF1/EgtB/PvdO family nonheme iron enzyme [Deltaproteobacteria bacterium]
MRRRPSARPTDIATPLLTALFLATSGCATTPRPRTIAPPTHGIDPAPMVTVPSGWMLLGSKAKEGEADERPQRKIWVSAFRIDAHEVTTSQYARCVTSGACDTTHLPGDEGPGKAYAANAACTWPAHATKNALHPLNCISFSQAARYCHWVRKRLPTEAEWEKAARGEDGRRFPWGEAPPNCTRAILIWGGKGGCGRQHTWPVGSTTPAGDSPYGAHDMAGNVYEWVSDWYAKDAYAHAQERDPRGPAQGTHHIVRGGSWYNYGNYLRAAYRTQIP